MQKFVAIAALAALAGTASARIDLALWTFETSIPTNAGPHAAEGGLFAASSFASGNTGGTYSNPVGNGSVESFSSNGWNANEYYQFTTSTLGYQNISITWDQARSSTGPADFRLAFSTDGVNFTGLLDYVVLANDAANGGVWTSPGSGGTRISNYTNTAVIPAPNAASLTVRLISLLTPSSANGTNRVDNVQIAGDLIPTPGAVALAGVAGLVSIRRRRTA